MAGPYVMAGLTHDDYTVGLPAGEASGRGLNAPGPERRVYPPEEEDELLSLQVVGWLASCSCTALASERRSTRARAICCRCGWGCQGR